MMAFIDDDSTMEDSVKEDDIAQDLSTELFDSSMQSHQSHLVNGWSDAARGGDSSRESKAPSPTSNNNNNNINNAVGVAGGANVNGEGFFPHFFEVDRILNSKGKCQQRFRRL